MSNSRFGRTVAFAVVAALLLVVLAPIVFHVVGWTATAVAQTVGLADEPLVVLGTVSGTIVITFGIVYAVADRSTRAIGTPTRD